RQSRAQWFVAPAPWQCHHQGAQSGKDCCPCLPGQASRISRITHTMSQVIALTDTLQRPLRDLRISVTDRCNFRCTYCMPRELFGPDHAFLPRAALLNFDEITRFA